MKNNPKRKKVKSVDWLKSEFKKVQLGEDFDGNPYYLGQDSNPELQRCIEIAIKYASQFQSEQRQVTDGDILKWTDKNTLVPNGFKVYKCTDCGAINIKIDNGEIRVGFCDKCEHPLWK